MTHESAKARRYVSLGVAAGAAVVLAACGSSASTTSDGPTSGRPSTTVSSSTPSRTTTSTTATSATSALPIGLDGRNWTVIPTRERIIALTFDGGANADAVDKILTTLTREHVPATMFLTGNFVRRFTGEANAIVAAGERIGNHSISHPYSSTLADTEFRAEVLGAQADIVQATGEDPAPWFRFPYGDYNNHTVAAVNRTGFIPIGWTVDTLGWKGASDGITVRSIVARVLTHLQPGAIVLLHCGSNPTDHSILDADALPTIIHDVRKRGYSFVTIDALLAHAPSP